MGIFCVEVGVFIDENVNFGGKKLKNKLKVGRKRIYFFGKWENIFFYLKTFFKINFEFFLKKK